MKLTPVDQIPKMNGYHKLQELIEEFTNGDAKIVKVEFSETDYKSPAVCRKERYVPWSALRKRVVYEDKSAE